VSPVHCFNSLDIGTKSDACHAADNILRKVKKHESGKDVWQTRDQGPLCGEGTPLMISGAVAGAFSWMRIRIRCPIIQAPIPEVHDKTIFCLSQDEWAQTLAAFL